LRNKRTPGAQGPWKEKKPPFSGLGAEGWEVAADMRISRGTQTGTEQPVHGEDVAPPGAV
jgi:hypothetical protein